MKGFLFLSRPMMNDKKSVLFEVSPRAVSPREVILPVGT